MKTERKTFSVKFPIDLVDEIDHICAAQYITRTSWLINAAKKVLNETRKAGADELINKLSKD